MDDQPIQFLDLRQSHDMIRTSLTEQWVNTLDANGFIGGTSVATFEDAFGRYCDTSYVVGVANGTDALELILTGLGIGSGHEVIVPANTFIATAEAVVRVGAKPTFVDVDPDTALMTPELVQAAMTERTAAVMAVHLYGQMMDMEGLLKVTQPRGIAVVEDAAQAHGATWNGRPAGSWGVAAGFSFYPGKNLGALGDGGAVTTNDHALATSIRSLANHGRSEHSKYDHDVVGRNSRLDGLQAAFLTVKLDELDNWTKCRREAAALYDRLLPDSFTPIKQADKAVGVYHLYVVRSEKVSRQEVGEALTENDIGWGIHYPVPCHRQRPYRDQIVEHLPVTDAQSNQILSLPMHPHLADAEIELVCDVLRQLV